MQQARKQTVLKALGITNAFGPQVVHEDLDLEVQAGEILGVVGGSGTGKSVLMRTLTGLHTPNAGQVDIAGRALVDLAPKEMAQTLSILFQQGALFSGLSVLENVMVPLREFSGLPKDEYEQLALMKLEMVGLKASDAYKTPSQLSGGMIKRAALARALAMDSKILFLDEPTAGLDPLAAGAFDELIQELNRSLGLTFLIITHDLDTLFTICTRIAVLVDRKVTTGTLDEMLRHKHPWIHEYFHGPRSRAAMDGKTPNRTTRGERG